MLRLRGQLCATPGTGPRTNKPEFNKAEISGNELKASTLRLDFANEFTLHIFTRCERPLLSPLTEWMASLIPP